MIFQVGSRIYEYILTRKQILKKKKTWKFQFFFHSWILTSRIFPSWRRNYESEKFCITSQILTLDLVADPL